IYEAARGYGVSAKCFWRRAGGDPADVAGMAGEPVVLVELSARTRPPFRADGRVPSVRRDPTKTNAPPPIDSSEVRRTRSVLGSAGIGTSPENSPSGS